MAAALFLKTIRGLVFVKVSYLRPSDMCFLYLWMRQPITDIENWFITGK